jgi:hypothetical protein
MEYLVDIVVEELTSSSDGLYAWKLTKAIFRHMTVILPEFLPQVVMKNLMHLLRSDEWLSPASLHHDSKQNYNQ